VGNGRPPRTSRKQSVFHRGVLRCRGPATRTPKRLPILFDGGSPMPANKTSSHDSPRAVAAAPGHFAESDLGGHGLRRPRCHPERGGDHAGRVDRRARIKSTKAGSLKLDRRPVSLLSTACARAASGHGPSSLPRPATIACTGILPGRRWLFFAMSLVKIAPRWSPDGTLWGG